MTTQRRILSCVWIVGAERHYRIEIGRGDEWSYSTCDFIEVTKSEGFTPSDTYTTTKEKKYTGITKWEDYDSKVEYPMGVKIEPVKGMMLKFYYSEESGTTGE